jgi:hypothetical protein
MIDINSLWPIVSSLGWLRVAYLVSLTLFLENRVTFEECLSLILVAVMLERLPCREVSSPCSGLDINGSEIKAHWRDLE